MPKWTFFLVVCEGYLSGETSFATRFQRSTPASRQQLERVVQNLAAVATEPEAFCYVMVEGNSDRQDSQNMSPEQRRDSELAASVQRAISAQKWLAEQIETKIGPPMSPDDPAWPRLKLDREACGASALNYKSPINEAQRASNRRVWISVNAFNLSTFPDDTGILEL